ncbi:hypothetical protein C8Q70DRAFT_1054624 [Cubamyces menziesii]|uniref:Lysine-specific metallo-endopeptidase domain-containing protein n=1 Tax=Trametes cubensis TaxID=1111947 RepID=A0AAD7THL5_9APHY|nr:hypothetical protein C8Q70DRAFT_1054624 [Cubamyces menziesii]KAJ8456163.1 hypothetical protein ONZ51_g12245 [Trametes cubensis]
MSFPSFSWDLLRSTATLIVCSLAATVLHHPDALVPPSTGVLSDPHIGLAINPRVTPRVVNCTGTEAEALSQAVPLAIDYIANALAELEHEGPEGDNYRRWFGAPNRQRHSTVSSHFEALARDDLPGYTFICNPSACTEHESECAFVDYTIKGVMNLCSGFFIAPNRGRNSRASIIVHEATHFFRNGFTSDHARGESESERLARSFPHIAITNADNYEYFAADACSRGGALHSLTDAS